MVIAATPTFRTDAFIDGAFRPALSGRRFATENPATGQDLTDDRRRRRGRHRPRGHGRPSRLRRRPLVAPLPRRAQGGHAGLRRPHRGERRGAGAARLARGRQADHGLPRDGPARDDQDLPLVRGGGRQAVRLDRADGAGRAGHDHPRADRGRRGGPPVELPDHDGGLEGGPGPDRRQQPRHQAGRAHLAQHDPPRRAGRRGRHPRRCLQRRPGSRRDGRPGARTAHGRQRPDVHGLDRGRPLLPALLVGEQPQAGRPRVRRQEPAGRDGRRARPRPGRRRTSSWPASRTWARTAPAARGSSSTDVRDDLLERIVGQDGRLDRRRPAGPGDPDRPDDRGAASRQGARLHRVRARAGRPRRRRRWARHAGQRRLLRRADGLRWRRQLDEDRPRRDLRRRSSRRSRSTRRTRAWPSPTTRTTASTPRSTRTTSTRPIRAARTLRAGTVSVNAYSEGDITTPFGGFKESGFGGRDKGLEAFDQYTEKKTVCHPAGRGSSGACRTRSRRRRPLHRRRWARAALGLP